MIAAAAMLRVFGNFSKSRKCGFKNCFAIQCYMLTQVGSEPAPVGEGIVNLSLRPLIILLRAKNEF